MYMHEGTTDFLKWCLWIGAIFTAVSWVAGIVGGEITLIIIGAIVLVIVFAAGALFAHMNQRQTLDAITKFSAQDAQIDKYRQQSFKEIVKGDAAWQKAAAQVNVLDARRVHQLASQQAKLLTDAERSKMQAEYAAATTQQTADAWTWDDDNGADFQEWR